MKKINAFTLMELMIGMIIGSIVVGFCYTGYRFIFRQYLDYKKVKEQVNEAMFLNTALTRDFSRSLFVEYKGNSLYIKSDSAQTEYKFTEQYILRNERDVSDTFHLAVKEIAPVFINRDENTGAEIISGFSFSADVLGQQETFQFSKIYSAAFLMQHDKVQSHGN